MIFSGDRKQLRQRYADAWQKAQGAQVLSPLESQIAQVIEDHPEYQAALGEKDLTASFAPEGRETNPFLHMGLHLAIRDQVATDRPPGISKVFQELSGRYPNPHETEHRMLDCLAETLWEAQNQNAPPDEQKYLERLRKIA